MIRLLFPLAAVITLADHAIAATEHRPSFSDTLDDTTPTPALLFVGDQGLYLMSNGVPHLPDPANEEWSLVVYADAFDDPMSKHTISDAIGGDDFSEVLPLHEKLPDGMTLHASLTAAVAAGATHFAIDIDPTNINLLTVTSGKS
jgi:hypothetical protein